MNNHPHQRRGLFLILTLWILPAASSRVAALNEENMEYSAKLAFLYNFAKFVEWPPGSYRYPNPPFVICVVGRDPFSPGSESDLRTRMVSGHPIEVRILRGTDGLSACNMVFIPITEKDQTDNILGRLRGSSTLTVGETAGFAARGGMINLTLEENRLRFEINQLAAERAGLKISSKLLSLAKLVADDPPRP